MSRLSPHTYSSIRLPETEHFRFYDCRKDSPTRKQDRFVPSCQKRQNPQHRNRQRLANGPDLAPATVSHLDTSSPPLRAALGIDPDSIGTTDSHRSSIQSPVSSGRMAGSSSRIPPAGRQYRSRRGRQLKQGIDLAATAARQLCAGCCRLLFVDRHAATRTRPTQHEREEQGKNLGEQRAITHGVAAGCKSAGFLSGEVNETYADPSSLSRIGPPL